MLTSKEISDNYRKTIAFAGQLLKIKLNRAGKEIHYESSLTSDLIRSAVADEEVINLLASVVFNEKKYEHTLFAAIERCSRELLHDLQKNNLSH